jgi:type IV pilus assembly protein PilA
MACGLQTAPRVHLSLERRCSTTPRYVRGFTLVELMIVVAIIAILAILALVGYRKMVNASHTAEATHMVQAIRVAQESYRSETQQYANISAGLYPPSMYPVGTPVGPTNGRLKTAWGAPCASCALDWSNLPIHPDGPVAFGYATIAGPPNPGTGYPPATPNIQGQTLTWPAASSILDNWYIITALGDPDGDATTCATGGQGCTLVVGTSWENDLYVDEED